MSRLPRRVVFVSVAFLGFALLIAWRTGTDGAGGVRLPVPLALATAAASSPVPAPMPMQAEVRLALPITEQYEARAQFDVAVEEISGIAPLPGATETSRHFLVVNDEGRYDTEKKLLEGCLFSVGLTFANDGATVTASDPKPIPIAVGDHFARFDPRWSSVNASPVDLESIVALPGTSGYYLLSGERNPEDQTDNGANRLYVIRYRPGPPATVTLVAYFGVYDLANDLSNDRFEGVVAVLADADGEWTEEDDDAGRWRVFAFKERSMSLTNAPPYVSGVLTLTDGDFALEMDVAANSWPPLTVRQLAPGLDRVSSQADACVGRYGEVWVLDRWRRWIHRSRLDDERTGALEMQRGSLDYFEVVKDVAQETGMREPPPPGILTRIGFGRHEGITVDQFGWLYLAADLGGGRASTITVLAPKND